MPDAPRQLPSPVGILDNRSRGAAGDFLKAHLQEGTELSVVSAYFTISAYEALGEELERVERMRFLYGTPDHLRPLDRDNRPARAFSLTEEGLAPTRQLSQRAVARRCADWIRRKAEIRSVREDLLHGKMYHVMSSRARAMIGSSNLTLPGLGLADRTNVELNLVVDGDRDRDDLLAWFEEWWCDEKRTEDVKDRVLRQLELLHRNRSAQFIYHLTLFHLFGDELANLAGTDEDVDRRGLGRTAIWDSLFEFQRDAAKIVIDRVKRLNGCILADSVGLGKTYTALAVIRYFELRNERVLVLCPKKLARNWRSFKANSLVNPFAEDGFRYDVLFHTDLSRDFGWSGETDLATINWGNYDLVVIDESHNFRNNTRGTQVDGEPRRKSRYEKLMEDIVGSGANTKTLMLSATPVNCDLRDLRNQISFIAGGDVTREPEADGFFSEPERLELDSVLKTTEAAQRRFAAWALKPQPERRREGLVEVLDADFLRLLDGVSIARSRKHILEHYEDDMGRLGPFPTREKPESVYANIDLQNPKFSFDALIEQIEAMNLALYNPAGYLRDDLSDAVLAGYERDVVNGFTQVGRERSLIGMMKVNFLKRLESSVESFRLTLGRTAQKIDNLLNSFERFERAGSHDPGMPYSELSPYETGDDPEEDPDSEYGDFFVGGKLRFHLAHIDIPKWRPLLEQDRTTLRKMLVAATEVGPERDAKLAELRRRIDQKLRTPSIRTDGRPNRKVLVFTAFSDTAEYLYDNLAPAVKTAGGQIGLVQGSGGNRATVGRGNYDEILANFSPGSHAGTLTEDGIDVLVATDCISEGQNLQDCDTVINYDIHWNPVRIIQRFGRVDRIGSPNDSVKLVNFWPVEDLDRYLNVQNRVHARMALVDVTAAQGDNLLEDKETTEIVQQELQFRDDQLRQLREQVVDLEDLEDSVSLADFSLADFRRDLQELLASRRDEFEAAAMGLYAVVPPSTPNRAVAPGVIFCLRQRGTGQTEVATPQVHRRRDAELRRVNPLGRHYLVYIRDDGEVEFGFASARKTLTLFRELAQGRETAAEELCAIFDQRTTDGSEMGHYNELILNAVRHIAGAFSRRAGAQLGRKDGLLPRAATQPTGVDSDYELVTWLAIVDPRQGGET